MYILNKYVKPFSFACARNYLGTHSDIHKYEELASIDKACNTLLIKLILTTLTYGFYKLKVHTRVKTCFVFMQRSISTNAFSNNKIISTL
jgi:hypothetical protein